MCKWSARCARPRNIPWTRPCEADLALCRCPQIAETATLGDAILGALYNQRQRLVGAVEHRKQLNAELEESGNLMQRMMRRITFKHARWYGIIGLLVVAIVVTSWWKMTHPYLEHGRDGEG